MTRKHYIKFASKIADMVDRKVAQAAADMVISVAQNDNPRFDTGRFLTACEL